MKIKTIITMAAPLVLATVASAQVFTYNYSSGTLNAAIPDGDVNGVRFFANVSGAPAIATDVNVFLNIVGNPVAFNGDYYVSLVGPTGAKSVLLNRVGVSSGNAFGYADNGVTITLDNQAANGNIHLYQNIQNPGGGTLAGSWVPDGRDILPTSPASLFDSTSPTKTLDVFNGTNPNGQWILLVADLGAGQGLGALQSWGLAISGVPEPRDYVFVFGVALVAFAAYRRLSVKTA
jgi:subtilisin-like proprotein convertase family protein